MMEMVKKYEPEKIEPFWQKNWQEHGFFVAEDESPKPKYYILVEFPYPSGAGLHVGHVRSYTALDVMARQKRMHGYNVMYPIGWDAFGLPTENYAIKNKLHPAKATAQNIATFKKQIHSLGLSFDWSREINTTDPKYYKWTQWIFLQLFKQGLAYKKKMPINWCPSCKIGLANEEVVDGKCERCGVGTEKREKEQWLLRITKYADRLITDLKTVDYLPKIATQQINWIGKSLGAEINFSIKNTKFKINVFTTRPDTIFGATYMVLAPEHELVEQLRDKIANFSEVQKYVIQAKTKSDLARTELQKEKTGMKLAGISAINPVTNQEIPVFIADYVLLTYGTGAIMAVPGHDQRDWEFSKKYNLPVIEVIAGGDVKKAAYAGEGILVNSSFLNGLSVKVAQEKIINWLENNKYGKREVSYKLRDWIFSRQHYWGEPIPIVHCAKCEVVPVPENQLPVELPLVEHYEPTDTGESPLAKIEEWVETKCPQCGGPGRRETDTMPNWAGSSWYFLRYTDPQNDKALASKEKLAHWLPVDLYNGGMEHTTLHLLYSRFWHKFLFDINVVPQAEPYSRRRSHGMILASDGRKMSKSFGNVINPDEVISAYGSDTMRIYEMFMGPYDEAIAWDEHGVKGCHRFLERVWRLSYSISRSEVTQHHVGCWASAALRADSANTHDAGYTRDAIPDLERVVHQTIKKVSQDIERMKFNTAVAQLMICLNAFEKYCSLLLDNSTLQARHCRERTERATAREVSEDRRARRGAVIYVETLFEKYVLLLSVFAPHICEEIWKNLGHDQSITLEKWPMWEEDKIMEVNITIAVQINGKLRDTVNVVANSSEEEVKKIALASEKIKKNIQGKKIVKIIIVPGKIVNVVVK